MSRAEAILLLGPTGSGKTPLGQVLEDRGLWGRPCRHFDFGRRLREIAACEGPADDEVALLRAVLDDGALLEDEHFAIAEKILRAFLADGPAAPDAQVVLNGLPRHVGQARDVDAIVAVRAVVELSCTPEAVLERIRTDAGGDRAARDDDDRAAVRRKLAIFAERTAPLVQHYRAGGVRIETVEVGPETTAEQLWKTLNQRGDKPCSR